MIRALLPPWLLFSLLAAICIFFGIYSFENARIFDITYFGLLLTVIYFCREEKDLVVVCSILILQRVVALAYVLPNTSGIEFLDFDSNYVVIFLLYSLLAYIAFNQWYDNIVKFSSPILATWFGVEFYWIFSGEDRSPINVLLLVIAIFQYSRYVLIDRINVELRFMKYQSHALKIDWQIQQLMGLAVIVVIALLVETLIYKFTSYSPSFLYDYYEVIMHSLALLQIYLVLSQVIVLYRPKTLNV